MEIISHNHWVSLSILGRFDGIVGVHLLLLRYFTAYFACAFAGSVTVDFLDQYSITTQAGKDFFIGLIGYPHGQSDTKNRPND